MGPRHGARGGVQPYGQRAGQGGATGGVRCSTPGGVRRSAVGSTRRSAAGVQGPVVLWGTCSAAPRRMRCGGTGESMTVSQRRVVGVTEDMQCRGRVQCRAVPWAGAVPEGMQLSVGLCSAVAGGCGAAAGAGNVRGAHAARAWEGAVYCYGGMQCHWGTCSAAQGMQRHAVCTRRGVQCNAPAVSARRAVLCSPVKGVSWAPRCCAARPHPKEGVAGAGEGGQHKCRQGSV